MNGLDYKKKREDKTKTAVEIQPHRFLWPLRAR
jgi:hypothetical protein